jgi:long-chain acyl-CoA synthetase
MANLENMPRDLRELLAYVAACYGTKTAFRDKTDGIYQDISYARFATEANALALMLKKRFQKGDRVAIIGENSYRLALSYMALTLLHAVPVPVDCTIRAKDFMGVAAEAEIKGVLYATSQKRLRRVFTGLCAVCFDKYNALVAEGKRRYAAGESLEMLSVSPDELAAIFFTSGTTGVAKGVMLSHRNLLTSVRDLSRDMPVDREDVFLSMLPLSHVYEYVCGFLMPLYRGATVAFGEGLAHILRNMREIRPTCMVTVPYVAEALYRKCWEMIKAKSRETRVRRLIAVSDPVRPLSARQAMKERVLSTERAYFGGLLRRLLVLGAGMDVSAQKGLRQLGVLTLQGYGITECAGLAAVNPSDRYRDGAAGRALQGGMLDIYDPQPDGSGEVRYKGDNVMLGYLGDTARTERVLRDGWYYTGDIGKLDADGYLTVEGRRENCIETAGGRLICPEALERLLCQSPLIKEAAVVGAFDPEIRDSRPVALIRIDDDYAVELFGHRASEEEEDLMIDEWIEELNAGLLSYQQLALYAVSEDPLPRDAAGNVRRTLIAEAMSEILE